MAEGIESSEQHDFRPPYMILSGKFDQRIFKVLFEVGTLTLQNSRVGELPWLKDIVAAGGGGG
jgi:hypothetical protein